ncbi:hypothetical protein D516_3319 [Rhodobacter sp. AKP1]|nr:Hypothetical Protein RSKD131_3894 [Cereibacter sphaeroides KD131]EKX56132.1 hypothetical protein D516_3319 [Rhodobacter sp. AKP1]
MKGTTFYGLAEARIEPLGQYENARCLVPSLGHRLSAP